jgi:hypothetical protein
VFDGMDRAELVALLSPLVLLQVGLAAFCVVKVLRHGTANLNRIAWILIIVLVNLFGPVAFLLVGRRKDA